MIQYRENKKPRMSRPVSRIEDQYNVIACRGLTINNWAETFKVDPEIYFMPRDVEEIREILLLAKTNKKKVRVVGKCHSPSDIALCSDYMISMKLMNNVLEVNPETHQVRVEAGITLTKLNAHIEKHNLALPVIGSVSDVTVGGVMNTATHGSGINHQVLSGCVVEVELITSSGDFVKCSKDEKSDIFYSALCGLGCMGVVTVVVLQCEPSFLLYQRSCPSTLDHVLEDLSDHLAQSDHFRFLWFPHTNSVSLSHVVRLPQGSALPPSLPPITKLIDKITSWFWDYAVGYHALEFAYWLSSLFPTLTPFINRIWFHFQYSREVERIDISHRIFNFECLFKQHVFEWSVPLEKTQVVLTELRRFLDKHPNLFVHFPVEVRFVAADDIYLSPAFGRDSCFINVIMYRPYGKTIEYQEWFSALEKIAREAGGRPHWAKVCIDCLKLCILRLMSLLFFPGSFSDCRGLRQNVSMLQTLVSDTKETGSNQLIFQ